jgi:hypothetical protein
MQTYFDALREGGHAVESKDIFVMYPALRRRDSDAQARTEVLEPWHVGAYLRSKR